MNSPRHDADDYTSPELMDGRDDSEADSDSVDEDDPYCNGCERQFNDMTALNQHLFASPKHNWCFDCSRDFRSEAALFQVSHFLNASTIASDSSTLCSIITPSPIADAISNALSVRECSRVPLASLCTSNLDATGLRDTTSLQQFTQ